MRNLLTVVAIAALAAALASCQREGPAEKAGRQVDRAADKAGRSIEKAGENMRDAVNGKK
jgi:hypothetical protein